MKHNELEMADYLKENDLHLSVDKRKWIFKCRTCDLDVKGNRKWNYVNFKCDFCDTNSDHAQEHTIASKHYPSKTIKKLTFQTIKSCMEQSLKRRCTYHTYQNRT